MVVNAKRLTRNREQLKNGCQQNPGNNKVKRQRCDDPTKRDYNTHSRMTENEASLPAEMWSQIFKHLDKNNLSVLESVNRKWRSQVYFDYGSIFHAGEPTWRLPWQFQFHGAEWDCKPLCDIRKTRIRELHLHSPFTSVENLDFMKKSELYFVPRILRRLHVNGFIPIKLIDHIVQPLINLSTLDLHICTILQWDNPKAIVALSGLLLEDLRITSTGFTTERAKYFEMTNFVRNLREIREVKLSRLARFELSVPFISVLVSLLHYPSLIQFLTRHGRTLKEIRTEHNEIWEDDEYLPIMDYLAFREETERRLRADELQGFEQLLLNVTTFSCTLNLNPRLELDAIVKIWGHFINWRFTGLHMLNLRHVTVSVLPVDIPIPVHNPNLILHLDNRILVRYPFLETCKLFCLITGYEEYERGQPQPALVVDFQMFQDWKCNLKKVSIQGNRAFFEPKRPDRNNEIVNGHLLPSSLEHLYINNVWVDTEQLSGWTDRLRLINLKHLHLEGIGQTHGLGLGLVPTMNLVIKKFTKPSSLSHLVLKNAVMKDQTKLKLILSTLTTSKAAWMNSFWGERGLSPEETITNSGIDLQNLQALDVDLDLVSNFVERLINYTGMM